MAPRYDLIVIGSGPAGEKGALQAAHCGRSVALIERSPYLGGTSINTGTIPSKSLREAALYFSGLRQRGLYGIDYSLKANLTVREFMFRAKAVMETERALIQRSLDQSGVALYQGTASLDDANTVRVCGPDGEAEMLRADVILIATGSSPRRPAHIPFEHPLVHDSDEILLEMERIPASMAVVGGGVIGCEYASIFASLDVAVTLIDSRDRLLPFVDGEIVSRLRERLESLGVCLRLSERVTAVQPSAESVHLQLQSGEELCFDLALFAAGRLSNVEGLGLEALGVTMAERGLIVVNEHYQTNVPSIYAAGDVIGFPALASTSMEQARVAIAHAFDLEYKQRMSPVQPLAVYTVPEVAMVGLTEQSCLAQQRPYLVGRASYDSNPRGQIIGDKSGMLKLIFSPDDKRLLGVHQIGEQASELIHIGAQVLAAGATLDSFIEAVYNYPTLADIYKYAANDGLDAWDAWRNRGAAASAPAP